MLRLKSRIRLIIAGVGEADKLMHEIENRNLVGSVEYAGWVDGDAKERLLSEADIFALPSYCEGLPVSLLEAMAHGLPVVAANVGGIPDLVVHGINGLLVEPGDIHGLRKAMEALLADAALCKAMSANNLQTIRNYSPESVGRRLLDLYETL